MQSSGKTNKKRWEDDINQFLKLEETEKTKGNNFKKTTTWIWAAKEQKRMDRNGKRPVKKAIKQQL